MKIVSLQSAVSYGHVGNSAAMFPLQRLGHDVWPIDTVQFSNHPGYGSWRGKVLSPDHVREVVHGLDEVGVLGDVDGIISGYLGDADSGEAALLAVERVKAHRPDALYLCDPVMGDDGAGIYVQHGIPEFLAARAVPAADVLPPNRFELEVLVGRAINTMAEAKAAAATLLGRGPRLVVVTSIEESGTIGCLAVTRDGAWAVRTPKLPLAVNGSGDVLSALLMAHLLGGKAPAAALSCAVSSLYGVLEHTQSLNRRELALVSAQDELVRPAKLFQPLPVE